MKDIHVSPLSASTELPLQLLHNAAQRTVRQPSCMKSLAARTRGNSRVNKSYELNTVRANHHRNNEQLRLKSSNSKIQLTSPSEPSAEYSVTAESCTSNFILFVNGISSCTARSARALTHTQCKPWCLVPRSTYNMDEARSQK